MTPSTSDSQEREGLGAFGGPWLEEEGPGLDDSASECFPFLGLDFEARLFQRPSAKKELKK